MTSETTIHIVDDDPGIRKSLSMLMRSADWKTREYASAEEFIENFQDDGLGCILLDVRMPDMGGLELQQLFPRLNIKIPVVIMTGHGDIDTAVQAMKAGAADFIEKPFEHDKLMNIIQQCLKSNRKFQATKSNNEYSDTLSSLSHREREIFDLLVEGKINKVIAGELNLSTRTVEAHRANIMNKLGTKSFSDLVKISIFAAQV